MLTMRLTGHIDLRVGEAHQRLPDGQPARGLLAWMALNPGVHQRDAVAGTLWPGGLVKAQRDSLKTALAKLRRTAPDIVDAYIVATRNEVGFREGSVRTDIDEARTRFRLGELEAALELMVGEVLPGIRMEWAAEVRREQHMLLVQILESLTEQYMAEGDFNRAVEMARRRVRLEPSDGSASFALSEALMAAHHPRLAAEERARSHQTGVTHPLAGRGSLPGTEEIDQRLRRYRWDAYVDTPEPGGPFPGYGTECVRIAFQATYLPDVIEVSALPAARGAHPVALDGDPTWHLRWPIDSDLDPADERVFMVDGVFVDGNALECFDQTHVGDDAERIVIRRYRPESSGGNHTVDILLSCRVFVGSDRRVPVRASAFRSVCDAEFRLTVAPDFHARQINIDTDQVVALDSPLASTTGPLFSSAAASAGAIARFPFALRSGSSVTFEIERAAVEAPAVR